jgi:hypothetical protein
MPRIRRVLLQTCYLVAAFGLAAAVTAPAAGAAPTPSSPAHQVDTSPQPPSNADFSGHGANTHGPYDSTRSGAPALNGNGVGNAVGRPCAGCVGKADNKNPHGQMPGGSDPNAGYECDRNHGIGRTNPAHTGCLATSTTPAASSGTSSSSSPGGSSSSLPSAQSHGVSAATSSQPGASSAPPAANLASTGVSVSTAIQAAIAMVLVGACLLIFRKHRTTGAHVR